jgi:hypothetical protein
MQSPHDLICYNITLWTKCQHREFGEAPAPLSLKVVKVTKIKARKTIPTERSYEEMTNKCTVVFWVRS